MPAHEHGPAIRALLHTHLAQRRPARQVHWFYTPMAMAFAADLPADVIVHDCMDELSAFDGAPPQLPVFERALLRRADLVFTGGRSLFRARQSRHPDLHLFPSSVDIDHFRPARDGLADLPAQRDLPRPRIGFFGVIDERMDVELLDRVAERRPEWQFVMAGPVVKIDPAILPRRPNIAWLGPIAYGALPALLANWDVGLMPFALNRATRFISPTKTLEYMAAGVPLVSTPIADVVSPYGDHGLVEIASDPLATIAALERTLAHDRAAWLQAADAYLATTSWDRTWARMHGLIEQRLAARARGALCQRGGGAELAPAIAAAAQHA
jgi:glycosyltransferase involved in cell wall biosynthesis